MLVVCRTVELAVLGTKSDLEESDLNKCLEDEPQGASVSNAVCTLHFLLGDLLVCWQVTKCRHECHSHCVQLGGLTKYSILSKLACAALASLDWLACMQSILRLSCDIWVHYSSGPKGTSNK